MKQIAWALTLAAVVIRPSAAQRRLEPGQMYERVIAIVPMIGQGTFDDPRRPLFVPATTTSSAPLANNLEKSLVGDKPRSDVGESVKDLSILTVAFQESDDGKFAIVELVARDRAAFKTIVGSGRVDVKTFIKSKEMREQIEIEARKIKKNFRLDQLEAAAH